MKTRGSSVWMYVTMVAAVFFLASCGNSQKKNGQATEQQMPAGVVVETETVVVEVDSIVPDSSVVKKNVTTPKKTK